jgi:hypothetical protein
VALRGGAPQIIGPEQRILIGPEPRVVQKAERELRVGVARGRAEPEKVGGIGKIRARADQEALPHAVEEGRAAPVRVRGVLEGGEAVDLEERGMARPE